MKKITVYSLSTCPVCKKVKELLLEKGVPYDVVEVDTLDSGEQWAAMKALGLHNPEKTFPTTVIEDIVVGFSPDELLGKIY